MANVSIDAETCIGCGLCVQSCPDCFELNDNNIAVVKQEEIGNCDCDLQEIASSCPVDSIKVS